LRGVVIDSFGKSFLLPVDVILGWILTNKKRQRVFNKLGDTLIVKPIVRDFGEQVHKRLKLTKHESYVNFKQN